MAVRTCDSGNLWLKSDAPADASKMLRKEPRTPTPTSSAVLALTHDSTFVITAKSAEASMFRNTLVDTMPPSATNPISNCGMRWAVASNEAPMPGMAESANSVEGQLESVPKEENKDGRLTVGAGCECTYLRAYFGWED